jgi:hypothetical protein
MSGDDDERMQSQDERLPLRWGVILLGAAVFGAGLGMLGGPLAGLGTGLAVVGLMSRILGH